MFAHLKRGVAAGLVAGLAFGLFVALVGGPLVGTVERAAGEHARLTAGAGSVVAGALWGLLFGAALGVAHYVLEPALPGSPAVRSLLLAGAGFVTVSGAPWLVLPPRPPGVASALPTDTRLLLYGGMMAAGALACGLALVAWRRARVRGPLAGLAAAALPVAALALLPVVAPLPATAPTTTLPAGLVATFRAVVVAGQVGLWLLLAGVHAWLLGRSDTPDFPAAGDPAPPAD